MNREDDIFFLATDSTFKHKDNTPIDYEKFRKFQQENDKKYRAIEAKRLIEERNLNLRQWDSSLPQRWAGASLSKMTIPAAKQTLDIIRSNGRGSFFVTGGAGRGKTFLSYAIIRKYIGNGWTSFPNVRIISESAVLNMGYTGFEGRSRFEQLLDRKYDFYFIDNVGSKKTYDEHRESPLLEGIIDHIYSNSLSAVFTSNYSARSFAESLGETVRTKFESLIDGRIIDLGHDEDDEDDNDSGRFGNFSDDRRNY